MEQLVVAIDPGHGGRDPGAVSQGYREKDFTMDIALKLSAELERVGIIVVLTRGSDIDVTPQERTNLIKDSGAALCLSVHVNAGGGEGAETIYSLHDNPNLATSILEAICSPTLFNKRRAYQRPSTRFKGQDYYYIIRDTRPVPTVIVENGFIDNPKDVQKLVNANFRHQLAKQIAQAVIQFLAGKQVVRQPAVQQAEVTLVSFTGDVIAVPIDKQRLIDGHFYLEARFMADALGGSAKWDAERKQATFDFFPF